MSATTINLLLAFLSAVYAFRVVFFVVGFLRERGRLRTSGETLRVSIVVPARNEQANLERCVRSVMAVDYPAELLQVIVVDDRSDDRTAMILDRLAQELPSLVPLHRTVSDVESNLRGKPGALQYGIDHADGDVILMTDADCVVNRGWVRAMIDQFQDPSVGLVAGLTSVEGTAITDRIQDVEWTYTQAMAAGGVGNGIPLGCFGNNLAVRRSAFEDVGGYRRIAFSVTEDLALQIAIHEAGYLIRHAVDAETSVVTLPAATFTEYVKQRHRWVRGGTALGMRAFWFVVSSLALWIGVVLSIVIGQPWWLLGFVALRVVADGVLITLAARAVHRQQIIPLIPLAIMLLMSTELFLPILAMQKKVTWKNQVFRP